MRVLSDKVDCAQNILIIDLNAHLFIVHNLTLGSLYYRYINLFNNHKNYRINFY